ncbi:uncharacterized protein isoform X2 [Rhodnius prolixus]|uniref:uncharacterized protein isoform X2 n=1 Tax=Rhodnius prolixus TaxID=13249 RepID=UPI003D18886D
MWLLFRRTSLLLAVLLVESIAENDAITKNSRTFHQPAAAVPRYWRDVDGSVHKSEYGRELQTDIQTDTIYPDKVQVVSSSLRILPRRGSRQRRSPWRTPREYQFVTRELSKGVADIDSESEKNSGTRTARLVEERRVSNYFPEERANSYPYEDYYRPRSSTPNRRIIYYATLPEVVRRPGEWTPPRPIYNPSPGYPPVRENEIVTRVHSPIIDVTRVHSSLIDVSEKNRFQKPSIEVHAPSLSTPKFTIIDAEPPYNRPPYPTHHQAPLPPSRYDQHLEQDRYDRHRYTNYGYNRYDYDRRFAEPYRPYVDERRTRPAYLNQPLPAQPLTVYRKPLDVRPLDPVRDLTTTIPSTTHKTDTSSTTTADPISQFERNLRRRT